MNSFPHLPPRASSIKAYRLKQILPLIILIIAVSALVGITVSLSVVSWFMPQVTPERSYLQSNQNQTDRLVVDPILDKTIRQSLLTIYESRAKIQATFYREDAKIGHGALLSSDGWAVMGAVPDSLYNRRFWEAVDSEGRIYQIEKFVDDSFAGLTYFKVSGEGFRVVTFPQDTIRENAPLLSIKKEKWQTTFLAGDPVRLDLPNIFGLWQTLYAFQVTPETEAGSVILDNRGQLVGFVDSDSQLIASRLIMSQISNLLAQGKVSHQGLLYRGNFVDSSIIDGAVRPLVGFYVSISPTYPSETTIGVGDVIVKIDGRPIDKFDLSYQVLSAPPEVTLTVLRQGAEIDIMVKKSEVGM